MANAVKEVRKMKISGKVFVLLMIAVIIILGYVYDQAWTPVQAERAIIGEWSGDVQNIKFFENGVVKMTGSGPYADISGTYAFTGGSRLKFEYGSQIRFFKIDTLARSKLVLYDELLNQADIYRRVE